MPLLWLVLPPAVSYFTSALPLLAPAMPLITPPVASLPRTASAPPTAADDSSRISRQLSSVVFSSEASLTLRLLGGLSISSSDASRFSRAGGGPAAPTSGGWPKAPNIGTSPCASSSGLAWNSHVSWLSSTGEHHHLPSASWPGLPSRRMLVVSAPPAPGQTLLGLAAGRRLPKSAQHSQGLSRIPTSVGLRGPWESTITYLLSPARRPYPARGSPVPLRRWLA
jgi:hypothetical protein